MKEKNICADCKYRYKDSLRCNRLVIPGGFGMNDRLGSDYKRNNQCPYFERGKDSGVDYKPLNFNNS